MTDSSDKEKTRKLSYDEYISIVDCSNNRKEVLQRSNREEDYRIAYEFFAKQEWKD